MPSKEHLISRLVAFCATIENIPSIKSKGEFCFKWMSEVGDEPLDNDEARKRFLLGEGVPGMSTADTREYLEFVVDQRLGQHRVYGSKNRSPSWNDRMSRSCPTSSNVKSPPIK